MTTIEIAIPTDLLWNKNEMRAVKKYAEHAAKVSPGETVDSLDEIARRVNGDIPSRNKHILTNLRCVEADEIADGDDKLSVEIGGICVFKRTADGGYQLTDAGEQLKQAYEDDDEQEWQEVTAELLCRNFVRLRTFIYYLGVEDCKIKYGSQQSFWGDEFLKRGELEYRYFATDVDTSKYNGMYTIAGLVEQLEDCDISHYHPWTPDIIRLLYRLEYAAAASGFEAYRAALFEIEEIKTLLLEAIAEPENRNSVLKIYQATTDTVELINRLAPNEEDTDPEKSEQNKWETDPATVYESLSETMDAQTNWKPNKRFSRVPNLLLDANKKSIIGPFLDEKIESLTGASITAADVEITASSKSNPEPLGGNIILVTHYAMSLLMHLDILTETENGNYQILEFSRPEAMQILPSEVVDDISVESEDDQQRLLPLLYDAYIDVRDNSNYAVWEDVRSEVLEQTDRSLTEFRDEVELLLQQSELVIEGTKKGVIADGEGPPGETDPRVSLSFPGLD